MKCEVCGDRKAVIHIQQVIGKEKVDLHLCEECALERGIAGGEGRIELSISSLLNGLVDMRKPKAARDKACAKCGSTWELISRREKMGCPECYTSFAKEVRTYLGKAGVRGTHKGKLPQRLLTYKTYLMDVIKLKENLKEALKKEDYEKAARLRDRIQELEQPQGQGEH